MKIAIIATLSLILLAMTPSSTAAILDVESNDANARQCTGLVDAGCEIITQYCSPHDHNDPSAGCTWYFTRTYCTVYIAVGNGEPTCL